MANLPGGNFDASTVEPSSVIEATPEFKGWHPMQFVESEMKPTKDGSGQYLQLVAQVLDGPYKGRKLWDRLNLVNNSETAREIAYRTLSAICHATDHLQVQDSTQLHNRRFEGHVVYVPEDGQYKAKNEVDGYRPTGGGAVATAAPTASTAKPETTPAPAAADQANESALPPWKRAS